MATVLKNGSRGEAVKQLQTQLNSAGYNLAVDGIYGAKTLAAVKDYQSKNNLTADGIAGSRTLGALGGQTTGNTGNSNAGSGGESNNALKGVSAGTSANLSKYQSGYTPSDSVNTAYEKLQSILDSRPEAYTSAYDRQIQEIYDKIMNREDFSYDMNADPLYQQYRQQAMNLGKQAMQDTMGQATALTGGYGSSYASTAGNQAYQQYLTQLNEIVPELQSNAYDRYRQEGEALLNQYSLAADRENTDYSRYQDALNDYYTRYSMANDAWQNEKNFDYTDYQNMLSYWQQQAAAENADYWNQQDYDFQREQFDWQKAQAAKSSGSSGRSGRSGGSSKSSGSTGGKTMMASEASAIMSRVFSNLGSNLNATKDSITNAIMNEIDRYEQQGYDTTALYNAASNINYKYPVRDQNGKITGWAVYSL